MGKITGKPAQATKQRGAVTIEFAVLFTVFFAIVYSIIAYSIPLLLTLSFKQISADAAREAVRVSPLTENYVQRISQHVSDVVDDSWLPGTWAEGDCPSPNDDDDWVRLPAATEGKSFGHYRTVQSEPLSTPRYHLNICLQRDYSDDKAIIPSLPVFGGIPRLPKDENGGIFLRGRSAVRL